ESGQTDSDEREMIENVQDLRALQSYGANLPDRRAVDLLLSTGRRYGNQSGQEHEEQGFFHGECRSRLLARDHDVTVRLPEQLASQTCCLPVERSAEPIPP